MRFVHLSANGWLLVVFGLILAGLVGEPAYRSITGHKSSTQISLERQMALEAKYARGPMVGEVAPPFTLKSSTTGHAVRLSDFRGRRVLLSFFCGCSSCREVARAWVKMQKKPLKGNPVVVGICFFEPDRLPMFVKETGAKDLIYLYDPGHQVGIRYGSRVCPRTWLIDERGKIAFRHEEEEASMAHSPVPAKVEALLSRSQLQLTSAG